MLTIFSHDNLTFHSFAAYEEHKKVCHICQAHSAAMKKVLKPIAEKMAKEFEKHSIFHKYSKE